MTRRNNQRNNYEIDDSYHINLMGNVLETYFFFYNPTIRFKKQQEKKINNDLINFHSFFSSFKLNRLDHL